MIQPLHLREWLHLGTFDTLEEADAAARAARAQHFTHSTRD